MKPSTTFTELSQPPLLGSFLSIEGKKAKIVNGRANATENASIVTIGLQNSPEVDLMSTEPTIGPVQENDTSTSVRAMKKMPAKPFESALASVLFTIHEGIVDLESPEERSGEDHEYEEEEDVRKPMRRQPIEDVGRHGVAAQNACDDDDAAMGSV